MTNQSDNRYVAVRRGAIGLGVAAALFGAGAAQADVTLFGEARLSINGDNNVPLFGNQQNTYMGSNQSAFGFKGSEDLGNGLKAVFHFEWQLDPTVTQFPGQTNTLSDREQFVGLQDDSYGRLVFGTVNTGYKNERGSHRPVVPHLSSGPRVPRYPIGTAARLRQVWGFWNPSRQL